MDARGTTDQCETPCLVETGYSLPVRALTSLKLVAREHEGEAKAVSGTEVHAVEAILDVLLVESRWAELRVGVPYEAEGSGESAPELHCFRWGMVDCHVVDGAPRPGPGVIAQETRFLVAFVFDCRGRQHKVL